MILAVISYPYHYHITQLAIEHALANIDDITDVKVIWDDSHISCPNSNYIPFSQVCSIPRYIKGWYAQQVIKLNLHKVLSGDIVILDGDVILNEKLDPSRNFYSPPMGKQSKLYSKVKELLAIDQYSFINAPLMHVKSSWLEELHIHSPTINQTYFKTAMTDWAVEGGWPISEWEVLYHFLSLIKKINRPVQLSVFQLMDTVTFEKMFNNTDNLVLNGKDNFSINFYEQQGVEINETLWKQIYGALV